VKAEALLRQPQPGGPAVAQRGAAVDVARVHELLEVVGGVGSEEVPALHEVADRQLVVADHHQHQRVDGADVVDAEAADLHPHHVEEAAVHPLDDAGEVVIGREFGPSGGTRGGRLIRSGPT
jgi:hypothetical protein